MAKFTSEWVTDEMNAFVDKVDDALQSKEYLLEKIFAIIKRSKELKRTVPNITYLNWFIKWVFIDTDIWDAKIHGSHTGVLTFEPYRNASFTYKVKLNGSRTLIGKNVLPKSEDELRKERIERDAKAAKLYKEHYKEYKPLKLNMLNRVFKCDDGKRYKLIGLNPRKKKLPVVAYNLDEDCYYHLSAKFLSVCCTMEDKADAKSK